MTKYNHYYIQIETRNEKESMALSNCVYTSVAKYNQNFTHCSKYLRDRDEIRYSFHIAYKRVGYVINFELRRISVWLNELENIATTIVYDLLDFHEERNLSILHTAAHTDKGMYRTDHKLRINIFLTTRDSAKEKVGFRVHEVGKTVIKRKSNFMHFDRRKSVAADGLQDQEFRRLPWLRRLP